MYQAKVWELHTKMKGKRIKSHKHPHGGSKRRKRRKK